MYLAFDNITKKYFIAPQPMVKPDFYGVTSNHEIAMILPQASEEYGPIAFYYLIVVPEDDKLHISKTPDQYLTDHVSFVIFSYSYYATS